MKRYLLFFFKNYFFWVLFFVVFKAIFLIANHNFTSALSAGEVLKVFLYGLKMDLSAAGYLSLVLGDNNDKRITFHNPLRHPWEERHHRHDIARNE